MITSALYADYRALISCSAWFKFKTDRNIWCVANRSQQVVPVDSRLEFKTHLTADTFEADVLTLSTARELVRHCQLDLQENNFNYWLHYIRKAKLWDTYRVTQHNDTNIKRSLFYLSPLLCVSQYITASPSRFLFIKFYIQLHILLWPILFQESSLYRSPISSLHFYCSYIHTLPNLCSIYLPEDVPQVKFCSSWNWMYICSDVYVYTRKQPDRPQHNCLDRCLIAQQYSSATFSLLYFFSRTEKISKNVIISFFIFFKIE